MPESSTVSQTSQVSSTALKVRCRHDCWSQTQNYAAAHVKFTLPCCTLACDGCDVYTTRERSQKLFISIIIGGRAV